MLFEPRFHTRFAMPKATLLPSMRVLRTFESAARLGSFSLAAEETHTTQSSVSRAISDLEHRLGTRLFDRLHRGVRLTAAGELYREAVVTGLGRIGAMGAALAGMATEHIVIACGHATSAMFLMPLRAALYKAVGGGSTHIRILTCDYELLDRVDEADIVLAYDAGDGAPGDRAVAFRQAVTPVCSPAYAEAHAGVLGRPVEAWGALTFLHLARPSRGWATWEDWFEAVGHPRHAPRYRSYHDYVYLVEDAVAGEGLALGWRRFIDRHIEAGTLVAARDGFVAFDRAHFARLTERGRHLPLARRCLDFFDELSRRAEEP